jgi:nitroreductase
VGHAAENIYLQAVSLGLGTVGIGAFDETAAKQSLNLPKEENPIYVMPVGKP